MTEKEEKIFVYWNNTFVDEMTLKKAIDYIEKNVFLLEKEETITVAKFRKA